MVEQQASMIRARQSGEGGMPRNPDGPVRRTRVLQVKVDAVEHEQAHRVAKERGTTVGARLRELATDDGLIPPLPTEDGGEE